MPGPVLCTEVSTVKPSKRQEVDGSVGCKGRSSIIGVKCG